MMRRFAAPQDAGGQNRLKETTGPEIEPNARSRPICDAHRLMRHRLLVVRPLFLLLLYLDSRGLFAV